MRNAARNAVIVLVVVLSGLFFLCTGILDFVWQVAFDLVVGWAYFLVRVAPNIQPNAAEIAAASVSLAIVLFGTHWFCQWVYANRGIPAEAGPTQPWPWRWTLRIVGVLVLMFACGTAAIGITHQIGWLATAREPLVTVTGRDAAPRIISLSNLKQLGLAAHNFHDSMGQLPVPTFTPDGRPLHSWHTALLPYIEQENLYQMIHKDLPWDHPDNQTACRTVVKVFLNPRVDEKTFWNAHYAPDVRLFDKPRKLSDFPDGISNTLLAGEAVRNPKPWADPLNWRDPRLGPDHPAGFGGPWPNGLTQILMLDGSTRTVTPDAWAKLLRGEWE